MSEIISSFDLPDDHMAAGSLLTTSQKAGPELAVMPSHAVSAKSQTLENKAYHVMSYHDMPAIGGQVGDEGLEPVELKPLKIGLKRFWSKQVALSVA